MYSIRNYKTSDFESTKEVLEVCNLFDKSYDTPEKFANKTPEGSIIVAEENSKIIGCVIFTWDGWDSSIYRLCVHPDYRKQGIGTRLFNETKDRLKKLGADVYSLRTGADNKEAQEFFIRMGAKKCGGPYLDFEGKL